MLLSGSSAAAVRSCCSSALEVVTTKFREAEIGPEKLLKQPTELKRNWYLQRASH